MQKFDVTRFHIIIGPGGEEIAVSPFAHDYLEEGSTQKVIRAEEVPPLLLAMMLDEWLESANRHHMVGVNEWLYNQLVEEALPVDKIRSIFLRIVGLGGLDELN